MNNKLLNKTIKHYILKNKKFICETCGKNLIYNFDEKNLTFHIESCYDCNLNSLKLDEIDEFKNEFSKGYEQRGER